VNRARTLLGLFQRPDVEERVLDEDDLRALERARVGVTVLGTLAVLGTLLAYATAGLGGLLVSLSVVAVGTLLVAVAAAPGSPDRPRRRRVLPSFDEPYPTFQQVSEQLSWSQVSPRHYDLVTRPLLVRLMSSRLADHHGIDLYRDPDAARQLVGEDVWWWLDPSRPAEGSSQPPGVDVRTLTRLVERLEKL
jgi:hypothetical protein